MDRRFFLKCNVLAAMASWARAQTGYRLRDAANPEFRPDQLFFRFEDITSPPFAELRRRFPYAEAVTGVEDEFQRILLLRHWIFKTLKKDFSKPDPPHDAISILAQGPSGGPFECTHATICQNAVMNAMGYVTRCLNAGPGGEENTYIASGNHGVNEIWSNQRLKWILSDGEFDGHFEKNGLPLSALEVRDEFLKNQAKDVDLVVGPERKKAQPELLFSPHCYRFVAFDPADDRHTQSGWTSDALIVWEDEYFKAHPWYRWQGKEGGKAPLHWALRSNSFLRVAHREWIEWTPNVISVKATLRDGVAHVRLHSNTPYFDCYQSRQSGGRWEKTKDSFDLKLEGAHIEREFRSVNIEGVAGPVSRLVIEQG
jgi:hypothetical protein